MSPGAPRDAQLGALSFLHRFGAALNPHFHFHVVVLDGVFSPTDDGEVCFHEATRLTPEHWHELQHVVQRRVLRYFRTHGLLDEADAHGMLSWQGSGGFSIDASVRIQGEDRAGVERPGTVLGRLSRWNGSTPPVATFPSARPSPGSSIGYPSRRRTAAPSSCSLRFSSWSGWLASCHPRVYIGIGITGCSLPIPSAVPPSLTSAGLKPQHPEPSSYTQ